MEKQLIEEISDGVATLTFNRPDRLNALSTPIISGVLGEQRRKALELLAPPPSRHDHSDGGIPRQSGSASSKPSISHSGLVGDLMTPPRRRPKGVPAGFLRARRLLPLC
jgi:hypothetical protein